MIELEQVGPIRVIHFRSGENRFNESFVAAFDDALDTVERSLMYDAVITVGGTELR